MKYEQPIPPILLIIFNRPDTTSLVLNSIKNAQPKQLFIAADGPRKDIETDIEGCEMARNIVKKIDWNCEVKYLFQDTNLGCRKGVVTAIDWFFDNVESGIILEDDCLPNPTFFRFCSELIEYYKYEKKVMMIGGNNYQFGKKRGSYSYYFSVFGHIWGWASWRRAWRYYVKDLETWPDVKNSNWIKEYMITDQGAKQYTRFLNNIYNGELDSWAYIWSYSRWRQNGLSIVPNCNLVENIGFDTRATHTTKKKRITTLKKEEISFPLKHPKKIERNKLADKFTVNHLYLGNPLIDDIGLLRYLYFKIRNKLPSRIKLILDPYLKTSKK
jgi:hypothetical protein